MKIVNVMNFVRRIDEREENSTERMLAFTAEQLRLLNEYRIDNTFLLQYDAVCDEDFVVLFKRESTDRTELGLWYEIVEPLTTACGLPYRSERGWKWDWHIIPGFSMAYTPHQREMLIDEAMRKFRAVFGTYPKTVASWLIDTHTLNYLAAHYHISAVAICRDQANTDAYTLLGGYFNQAYYPSVNNIFTPAQSREMQTDIPVFRLLGPCPIHNYDNHKYSSDEFRAIGHQAFTLEPCCEMGNREDAVRWMFDSYFGEESLGFAYAQIGQENSFIQQKERVLRCMRMQIGMLMERGDVEFKKMGDTGDLFRRLYSQTTPATSVVALNNFDSEDIQSVYYDCRNYTANLFRYEDKIFLRSLFLFDDRVKDRYLDETCTTFDAIYENLPIVDSRTGGAENRKQCGLAIDAEAVPFTVNKVADEVLRVEFAERAVTFYTDRIEIAADRLLWYREGGSADVTLDGEGLAFAYKGYRYRLDVEGAATVLREGNIAIESTDGIITLIPRKDG
ncbi:MAG: hypothetical protein IKL81_02545 [Clostridia bacterium]|nr:hypothetical protein [Clostridia bacterium]